MHTIWWLMARFDLSGKLNARRVLRGSRPRQGRSGADGPCRPVMPGGLRVVAVVGPTGCGKSQLSLDIVERPEGWRAEIINADSMPGHHGVDIGTAKVSVNERHVAIPTPPAPGHLGMSRRAPRCADSSEASRELDHRRHTLSRGLLPDPGGQAQTVHIRAACWTISLPARDPQPGRDCQGRPGTRLGRQGCMLDWPGIGPSAAASILASGWSSIVRATRSHRTLRRPRFTAELPH